MNVDTATARCTQKLLGQDASVGHHDCYISIMRREKLFSFVVLDSRGLKDTEATRESKLFDWRETYFVTASGRFVRLRPNGDHLMTVVQTPPERRHGSLRCAHEHYSHVLLATDYTEQI